SCRLIPGLLEIAIGSLASRKRRVPAVPAGLRGAYSGPLPHQFLRSKRQRPGVIAHDLGEPLALAARALQNSRTRLRDGAQPGFAVAGGQETTGPVAANVWTGDHVIGQHVSASSRRKEKTEV